MHTSVQWLQGPQLALIWRLAWFGAWICCPSPKPEARRSYYVVGRYFVCCATTAYDNTLWFRIMDYGRTYLPGLHAVHEGVNQTVTTPILHLKATLTKFGIYLP